MLFPEELKSRMESLTPSFAERKLELRQGMDFSSNDYLSFATDPTFRNLVAREISSRSPETGATGSRLLRGQSEIFLELENALAQFSGRSASLFFPSGYQANLALFSALLNDGDLVFSDSLNHASIIDGIRLSRSRKIIYPHLNVEKLQQELDKERHHRGLKVIVTESLFSMDGDVADLSLLSKIAEDHNALLVVDEAHATGLFGRGGGRVQEFNLEEKVFASLHTAGKALGASGAWIACDEAFKSYLVNYSRPFIYSTAPSPLLAVALLASLQYWSVEGPSRVQALWKKCAHFANALSLKVTGPIFPILLGHNSQALFVAKSLKALGFDVRAIRPPTVPEGSSRLRITLQAHTSLEGLESLISSLLATLRAVL